ncbi:RNA-binding protein MEX3B [Latimeria chalumnae]|uniref:Mex-3 RNA binding family member D n=1 Tax=Latimeria chalumnae TaxID=7897 RepID=H3B9R2_LATCH|nr:PREDICTED: RNA-binding protein MEX3D [Latimeria chalumnae]|eukprot:XP_005992004.1 PREDICTED: RNA-binding protein MEX3D [Latimeria chalumnae]
MPSSVYHPDMVEGGLLVVSHAGTSMHEEAGEDPERDKQQQQQQQQEEGEEEEEEEEEEGEGGGEAALRFSLDQLSILGLEEGIDGGGGGVDSGGGEPGAEEEIYNVGMDSGNGGGSGRLGNLQILDPNNTSPSSSSSPSPDIFSTLHQLNPSILGEQISVIGCCRKKSVNMTECVPVPSSEHVAEIVGRQGCKIKALRAKTNTYIKTPVRGENPVFIVTGRKEDVEMAKREILSAAEHFSMIRATRNKSNGLTGPVPGPPNLPGQTTIQVRVPYRVVGLVVGPKGATIKRIQQQTHTYIVTPSRDKEPVFEVTGMPENVDRAREEIEAHITIRTGSFIDLNGDNDFHSNGTDVSLETTGTTGSIWSKAPNPARRPPATFRNNSLSSLGSTSTDSYYSSRVADPSPTSPFSTSSGGGFTFGDSHTPLSTDELDFGLEFPALDFNGPGTIWSPFERSNPLQAFGSCSAINGTQRRNSSISGSTTPRLSPTPPEVTNVAVALDHPLARRVQSDPLSSFSWLPPQGSVSSFSNSTGYSSSSSLPGSVSATSGSPTESSSSDGRRKSTRDCIICFESEIIAALVPCGHNLFCMECAIRLCEKPDPECPVCHTPATQAIRIFS